jgi:hypothetical protein
MSRTVSLLRASVNSSMFTFVINTKRKLYIFIFVFRIVLYVTVIGTRAVDTTISGFIIILYTIGHVPVYRTAISLYLSHYML